MLAERFIKPLRAAEMMTTDAGIRIAPGASIIPLLNDPALCCQFWDLAAQVKGSSGRLPRRDVAHVWAANLTSWAPFLSQPAEQLDESLTLAKLSERVSTWGTVEEAGKQLGEAVDPIEWLNQFHALISKAGHTQLFEQKRLIPSQSGELKKITELRRDPGIDEELKGIAASVGLPTRHDLLDRRMRLETFSRLSPKTEEEVLTGAVQKFKDKAKNAKSVDAAFARIAVWFFVWLVRHSETDKLDGFPLLTRATSGEDAALATFFRDPAKTDERPLAPTGCWPDSARLVADLFPKRQTLSDAYREALPDDALWGKMGEEGYVRLNPLYKTQRRGIPFIPDEPLLISEKDRKLKHRTKDDVEVSALAFFEKDETGLDAVRRSKSRAVGLLLFLASYVLEADAGALDAVEDTRISLMDSLADIVRAADNDPEKVRLVAEEIRQSPKLLDEIREHRERREKVQRNQSLGAEVERLLKEALQDYGLKVTRTGVGSDYEVEEDYVVDDKEVILAIEDGRRSFLVEVKATVGKVARMTVTQAETAVGNQDRFILCMVQLDSPDVTPDIVRERSRFVMDIGQQIQPLWEAYRRYQDTKGEVCSRVGEVELIVRDSEVRFAVGEGAWAGGRSLHDAVEQILSACRGEDGV